MIETRGNGSSEQLGLLGMDTGAAPTCGSPYMPKLQSCTESATFQLSKQIDFLGLRQERDQFRCQYPTLLIEWLKEQGFVEEPARSGKAPRRLHRDGTSILIYSAGAVRVRPGKDGTGTRQLLQKLL